MLVRQCLHLLFLALDLEENDASSAGSSKRAQAHVPLADAYFARAKPGLDSNMAAAGGAAASASDDLMPESSNIRAQVKSVGMVDSEDEGAFGCLGDFLTGAGIGVRSPLRNRIILGCAPGSTNTGFLCSLEHKSCSGVLQGAQILASCAPGSTAKQDNSVP